MNPYFNLLVTEVRSAKASHDWKSVKHLIYHIHLFQMGQDEATEVLHYISELLRWALLQESGEDWDLWEWETSGVEVDVGRLLKYLAPISPCAAFLYQIINDSRRSPVPTAFFMDKSYLMDYLMGEAGDVSNRQHLRLFILSAADYVEVKLEKEKESILLVPMVQRVWNRFQRHWTKEQVQSSEDLKESLFLASMDIGIDHFLPINHTMPLYLRSET